MIGANGAGKTTLFRMITGEESPDSGTLELGDTVQLAYVDQSRDALDPEKTVWEEISDGLDQLKVGEREVNSRQYTAGFNFKGTDQQARIGKLSGGERNRVHLAKLLRSGGNLLLLDEPTNDLDVDTLRALEDALLGVPRLRGGDLPRPLVPRPHRHARAGLRGRLAGDLVRGQLRGLRGAPPRGARRGRRPAPPDHLQAARAWLTTAAPAPRRLRPRHRRAAVGARLRELRGALLRGRGLARLARRARTARRLSRGDAAARADRDGRRPGPRAALADDPLRRARPSPGR